MARKTDRRRERRDQSGGEPGGRSIAVGWRTPEIRTSTVIVGAIGLVFLVANLVLLHSNGVGILYLPLVLFVLDSASVWIVLTGNRVLRTLALVVVVLTALVQMVSLLGNGPLWFRICCGVLAAASVYALVVLNTKPVRVHFGLDTSDS
jgi:hypothetical protein